jgi:alpha-beta hydrolase superfamily lysophospholipase
LIHVGEPRPQHLRKRRRRLVAAGVLAVAFVGFNLVLRRHARAFLEFSHTGTLTRGPDELSTREKIDVLVSGVSIPKPSNAYSPAYVGWEYDTIEIETIDGATLSVWVMPAPASIGTVVLFHGYSQSKDSLLHAAAQFRALGYSSYVVDFRGSGDSSESYTTIGVHEARDVAAVVAAIERCDPIVLYGVSMGAAAILRALAHEGVEADAVILDAPFDRMLTTVRNRFEIMEIPAFPSAELLVFWGGRRFGFSGFEHDPVEYAALVSTPTLILHGSEDRFARPHEVTSIFDALVGPKKIAAFEGVGHEQIAVVRTREWHDHVVPFLDEHARSPSTRACSR